MILDLDGEEAVEKKMLKDKWDELCNLVPLLVQFTLFVFLPLIAGQQRRKCSCRLA